MIDEQMPDLMVLDYKMTGMDGLAVMKARPRQARISPAGAEAPTATSAAPRIRAGLEAGVTDDAH